ncbi:hypothetical protein Pan54_08100 [Rubinisphaera italica]|uniref:Uncharacterized protein n=1 Tax=Rubinisphaera italica TaxID=2527969 RepID=A0A5C5XAB2_9PLAN|nr:hypothetical protein Pan54_08100 [Rubinisphaera italica]
MAAYLTLNSAGLSMLLVLNAGENSNTTKIIGHSVFNGAGFSPEERMQ